MTISTREQHLPAAIGGPASAGHPGMLAGIALMTGSAASNQLGAATAALAFPVLGPAGVVAVRQWVAAAALLTAVRPKFASFTWPQWRPVLALALIFATMNLSLYTAIDRIGLGLAVTLEFLGPLSVALAASRRVIDLGCALIAGAAVVVLARPQPSTDYAGIFLALLAAACWAGYILVNRVVGARLPGSQGPAAAAGLSALLYVPVGIWTLASHPVTGAALGRAATAGILCSAVPMVADMLALRRVPARFFGVFMSLNPVFAVLTGLVVLRQSLELADWLAVAAIVTANAVSVSTSGQARGCCLPGRPSARWKHSRQSVPRSSAGPLCGCTSGPSRRTSPRSCCKAYRLPSGPRRGVCVVARRTTSTCGTTARPSTPILSGWSAASRGSCSTKASSSWRRRTSPVADASGFPSRCCVQSPPAIRVSPRSRPRSAPTQPVLCGRARVVSLVGEAKWSVSVNEARLLRGLQRKAIESGLAPC